MFDTFTPYVGQTVRVNTYMITGMPPMGTLCTIVRIVSKDLGDRRTLVDVKYTVDGVKNVKGFFLYRFDPVAPTFEDELANLPIG